MFKEEARWISKVLSEADIKPSATVLDIGASDLKFRTVTQPHIHEFIHKPLLEKGVRLNFLDIKNEAGVDIVADLTSSNLADSQFSKAFDLIICCNILEHVRDRVTFMRNVIRFSHTSSLLMVTVPLVYPKHNDPIDTMYRPTAKQLVEFVRTLTKCHVLKMEELTITDKEYYIEKPGRKLDYLLMREYRALIRWYVKPWRWKVSCALLSIEK